MFINDAMFNCTCKNDLRVFSLLNVQLAQDGVLEQSSNPRVLSRQQIHVDMVSHVGQSAFVDIGE